MEKGYKQQGRKRKEFTPKKEDGEKLKKLGIVRYFILAKSSPNH